MTLPDEIWTEFELFHGAMFPRLRDRENWIKRLREVRPELTRAQAAKEWQHRRCLQTEAYLEGAGPAYA